LKGLIVGGVIFRNHQIYTGSYCSTVAWELVHGGSQKGQSSAKTLVCSVSFHTRHTDSSGDFVTVDYQVFPELAQIEHYERSGFTIIHAK